MTKKRGGRPSKYNQALCDLICERVATHAIGLRKLCAMFDDMPSEETINQWRFKHPEFAGQYARAKVHQAELLADYMHDLADEIGTYQDSEGNTRVDSGSVQAKRLAIDTIKWTLSKLLPRKYGDKLQEAEPEKLTPDDYKINVNDPVEAAKIYQQIMRRGK